MIVMNERCSGDIVPTCRRRLSLGARAGLLALVVCVTGTGAAKTQQSSPASSPPRDVAPSTPVRHRLLQIGKASWYGKQFLGRRTANGERFDPNALTCAHRTLPLGSWVRITNLLNRRSLLLRVTDRGPYARNRIVDLSAAAARRLAIAGLGKVQIEPVEPDTATSRSFTADTLLARMVTPPFTLIATR